ncbi:DUF2634 domain-containing protein [Ureibacillus thermosphaericus]|uniref:DUF2634 domain-containing protein n=1 Tax=Ureibacillus thermosphaericus TaxID=51173 RepID=A0A840PQ61_URETH|nr:DUF2634 domain-containing protein [Ureibacillus thermosphaericus]MBB5148163.1 hypothetical protein [Ureibacillus thermosphaericus]NKZ31074.1 DUF2634 domain-containing protein [Ureibacillus thermosphaericus]
MLPQVNDDLINDFEEVIEPSKTFYIDFERGRMVSFVDGQEAVKQAIFLMLNIERYDHLIFSWNTGGEFKDLIGKPTAYVASEVQRRITECLLQDDRITDITDFEVTTSKNKVHVTCTAHTIFGEVQLEREVEY